MNSETEVPNATVESHITVDSILDGTCELRCLAFLIRSIMLSVVVSMYTSSFRIERKLHILSALCHVTQCSKCIVVYVK